MPDEIMNYEQCKQLHVLSCREESERERERDRRRQRQRQRKRDRETESDRERGGDREQEREREREREAETESKRDFEQALQVLLGDAVVASFSSGNHVGGLLSSSWCCSCSLDLRC